VGSAFAVATVIENNLSRFVPDLSFGMPGTPWTSRTGNRSPKHRGTATNERRFEQSRCFWASVAKAFHKRAENLSESAPVSD